MKKTSSTAPCPNFKTPLFLSELLAAHSPSGYENEARAVIKKFVEKSADKFSIDAMGSCHAKIHGKGGPTLMLAGHIDELGLIIKHNRFISSYRLDHRKPRVIGNLVKNRNLFLIRIVFLKPLIGFFRIGLLPGVQGLF